MESDNRDLHSKFCSSPWLHARINNTGHYEYCRWATKVDRAEQSHSIHQVAPLQWFQRSLAPIRQSLLAGTAPDGCEQCHRMEAHGKVSGRQRQLLKVGVTQDHFDHSLRTSPWFDTFLYSDRNQGITDQAPQDWQIDLGNYCNSACVFCSPYSSSRLAAEFRRIDIIQQTPPRSWCEDEVLLERFLQDLERTPHLRYLHFIGGEPLIIPAFRTILQRLVNSGQAQDVTVGCTTNLTVWDQGIFDLLDQFRAVNLGMSVECIHPLNDYVRWPSDISKVTDMVERWRKEASSQRWLFQLRITPTVLSIWHLDSLYRYAWQNEISVESCNFLHEPLFMRPSLVPMHMRRQVQLRLQAAVPTSQAAHDAVINTRDPALAHQQIQQDLTSYCHYLDTEPDLSHLVPDLVQYLHKLERSRGNCILDYLPEYETLLRSAGY